MSNYLNYTIDYVDIIMNINSEICYNHKCLREHTTINSYIIIRLEQKHNLKELDLLICNGIVYRVNSILDKHNRLTISPIYNMDIKDINISQGDIITRFTYEENKELQNLEICSIGEKDNIQIKEESTCKTQRVICFECNYFTGLNHDCNRTKPECYI